MLSLGVESKRLSKLSKELSVAVTSRTSLFLSSRSMESLVIRQTVSQF